MVLPAHQSTGGLVMLAASPTSRLTTLYDAAPPGERIDLTKLRTELEAVRRSGIAINLERTERGLIAMGHGITDATGTTVAAVSVSMPSVRYSTARIRRITPALTAAAELHLHRTLLDSGLQAGGDVGAQRLLVDLADLGGGELVDQHQALGELERRDAQVSHRVPDVVEGDVGVAARDDVDADALAELADRASRPRRPGSTPGSW